MYTYACYNYVDVLDIGLLALARAANLIILVAQYLIITCYAHRTTQLAIAHLVMTTDQVMVHTLVMCTCSAIVELLP